MREHGRLDFLICNACPPVLPLRLEPNATGRIGAISTWPYLSRSCRSAEFLELLNRSDGCAVIISSIFVEHPVKEFPHYIAAKQAVEMLGRVASLQYRRVSISSSGPKTSHCDDQHAPGSLGRRIAGADRQPHRRAPGRSTAAEKG